MDHGKPRYVVNALSLTQFKRSFQNIWCETEKGLTKANNKREKDERERKSKKGEMRGNGSLSEEETQPSNNYHLKPPEVQNHLC